jgi:hypothetical protein
MKMSMKQWWNGTDRGKLKYSGTCPRATLSITNTKWTHTGSNPGPRGGRPATNRLSHDKASTGEKEREKSEDGSVTGSVQHSEAQEPLG